MHKYLLLSFALVLAACSGEASSTANPNDPDMTAMPPAAPSPSSDVAAPRPATEDDMPSGPSEDVDDGEIPWRTADDDPPADEEGMPAEDEDEDVSFDDDDEDYESITP